MQIRSNRLFLAATLFVSLVLVLVILVPIAVNFKKTGPLEIMRAKVLIVTSG